MSECSHAGINKHEMNSEKKTIMQTRQQKPFVVPAGEGKRLNVLGEIITCKVPSGETNGAYSIVEEITPPNNSTIPPAR